MTRLHAARGEKEKRQKAVGRTSKETQPRRRPAIPDWPAPAEGERGGRPRVTVVVAGGRGIRRRWLQVVAEAVMEAEGCDRRAELSVAIGDDGWIRELNRKYRKRDRPTDVLAFPQGAAPAGGGLLGEVAISAETARRQAAEAGHSLHHELALLLAHGILHLAGWRDDRPEERGRMMSRAERILKRWRGLKG